jgi:hypothetical protein
LHERGNPTPRVAIMPHQSMRPEMPKLTMSSRSDMVETSRRAKGPSAAKARHRCPSNDLMFHVAAHEAGHAVAYIRCYQALEQHWQSFDRVFIRRDFSTPYIDHLGREIDCAGLCEGVDVYVRGVGFNIACPEIRKIILANMEWLSAYAWPVHLLRRHHVTFAPKPTCAGMHFSTVDRIGTLHSLKQF